MEEHPIYAFARKYNPKLGDAEIKAKYIDGGKYIETLGWMREEMYPDLDQESFLTKFHSKYEDLSKKKEPTASVASSSAGIKDATYSWDAPDPKLVSTVQVPKTPSYSGSKITPEAMNASKRASQELALRKARERGGFDRPAQLSETQKAQVAYSPFEDKEYKTKFDVLSEDTNTLQKAIDASEARIKEKWGENWMQDYNARVEAINNPETQNREELIKKQQEFEADQYINDRNNFITALEANQEAGRELLYSDKYERARALERIDQERQKKAETQGWGNSVLGIAQRAASKFIGSVGHLMNIGENVATKDKKYTAWDAVEDFLIDFQSETENVAPRPTKYTRPLFTKTATTTLNGQKVQVDYDGDKPAIIRDSKGAVIRPVSESDNFDLKPKNQWNGKGLVYQTGEVLADVLVQAATTKGIGGTLVKTGMGAKTAYQIGVTASTMGQMTGPLYNEGLKMFDGDKKKASIYAATASLAIGVSSNLFGLESKLAGGKGGFLDNMTVQQAVKSLNPKTAGIQRAKSMLKEGLGEAFEETIVEQGIQNATAMMLNGDPDDIDLNEMKGTAVISFAIGALLGGSVDNSMWLVAAENPDEFRKALQAEKDAGKNIDVEKMYNKALKIRGLSEIKDITEEDVDALDKVSELKDKFEKAKAIGLDEQAKVFKEEAANLEKEVLKEKEVEGENVNVAYETSKLEGAKVNIDGEIGVVEKTDSGYVLNTGEELLPIEDEEVEAQLIERGVKMDRPKESQKKVFETSVDKAISGLDITQEQADALKQTTSANARNWARRTGKTEEEFYEKFKPTVSRETSQIPDDALKQIVGEKANVPEAKRGLQVAKLAEGKYSPRAIYLATGWEKVDGKWKYDLPDVEVETLEGTNKLGDVAKGGILDAYPDAKDIEVTVDPNLKTQGVRQGNKISIRDGADKSTLIHELQHWVQQKEGFAGGATLDRVSEGMFSKLQSAKDKFMESNPNLARALKGEDVELSEGDIEKLVENKQLLNNYQETVTDIFNKYQSVVGEVEARNAARRSEMSPSERKRTPISETEDTKDKIYLQEEEGEVLGAFSTIDGEASAWLFDGATIETLFHEIDPTTGHFGHAVLYDIFDNALPGFKAQAEEDVKAIEEWLGAKDRNWTREQHEKYVAAGEKYLREGIAPTSELKPVFERLKQWLTDIFNSVKGRKDINITPEVRVVFDRMLGGNRAETLPIIDSLPPGVNGFITDKFFGFVMSSKAMDWIKKVFVNTFYAGGNLPKDVAALNYRRIARIQGMMKQAEITSKKLSELIKNKSKQQVIELNNALQTGSKTYADGTPIEPEVLLILGDMRKHIDSLSGALISSGIATGKLEAVISNNLETYLTRSYEVHFNKEWIKKVKDTAAYTRARAYLEGKFAQEEADAKEKIKRYQERKKTGNKPGIEKQIKTANNKIKKYEDNKSIAEQSVVRIDKKIAKLTDPIEIEAAKKRKEEKEKRVAKWANLAQSQRDLIDKLNERIEVGADKFWDKKIENQRKKIGRDVDAELEAMLMKQSKDLRMADVAKSGSLGSMNLGVFKKRKGIPEEIRELFGEVKDPLVNYMTSIFKIAHILENNKFLAEVEKQGLDKFLFDRPTGNHTVALPDTAQMGDLAGYYTTPEIAEAFRTYNKPIGDFDENSDLPTQLYGGLMKVSALSKSFMTVYSIGSGFRNVFSNPFLMLQKGGLNPASKHVKRAIEAFRNKDEKEIVELYSRGVMGEGITFAELADIRKQYRKEMRGVPKDAKDKFTEGWEKYVTGPLKAFYAFGDDFFRVIDYYRNQDKMAVLNYGKKFKDLTPDEQENVKQLAADRVSSESPTYSRLPRNIKALRRNPVVAPFPSFPYEMVRVSYNIFANLVNDMKNGQDTTVKVGGVDMSYKNLMFAKTMIGAATVSIVPFIIKDIAKIALGWDDDDEESLKYFVPFYHEGSILIPHTSDKGNVSYLDLGYMMPQGHILSTFAAFNDTRYNVAENTLRASEKFFEPFYSLDPLMKAGVEAVSGSMLGKTGRPISVVGEQGWLLDRFYHVQNKMTPGTIKSLQRVIKSFNEPETDYYGKLDPLSEGIAIFPGYRSHNIDIHRQFGFVSQKIAKKIDDTRVDYKIAQEKEVTKAMAPDDRKEYLEKIRNREIKDYNKFVTDLHKIYVAAIDFPEVDKRKIDQALETVKLDPVTRNNVKNGKLDLPKFLRQ